MKKILFAVSILLFLTCCYKGNENKDISLPAENPPAADLEEVDEDGADSFDKKGFAENEANLEYSLYYRRNETDIFVGNFEFPQDSSYYTSEHPFLLTTSSDGYYAVLGIYINNEEAMNGMCHPFRLNLETAELTDYENGDEFKISTYALRKALDIDGFLYPKLSVEQSGKEITYTYFNSKTLAEEKMKCYPDLAHERLNPVSLRHNSNNGDWYYFFQIPRYDMETPKRAIDALSDIELYCTVFDSNGNAKRTNATSLTWPLMHGIYGESTLLTGEFMVWNDKIYFSYVSKWQEDSRSAENISFVEYNPYSNDVRELAVYQSSYYHDTSEVQGNFIKSVKNGVLTFSLSLEGKTWEQHQISVADGKELSTPVIFNLPEYPRVYIGDSPNGGCYYIIKSGKE